MSRKHRNRHSWRKNLESHLTKKTYVYRPSIDVYEGSKYFFVVMGRNAAQRMDAKLPHIVISVSDFDATQNVIPQNNLCRGIFRLFFDNAYRSNPKSFTDEMASKLVRFVSRHRHHVKMIVVHCNAGCTRSAGIAQALWYWLENKDDAFFTKKHSPDQRIRAKILRKAGFKDIQEPPEPPEIVRAPSSTNYKLGYSFGMGGFFYESPQPTSKAKEITDEDLQEILAAQIKAHGHLSEGEFENAMLGQEDPFHDIDKKEPIDVDDAFMGEEFEAWKASQQSLYDLPVHEIISRMEAGDCIVDPERYEQSQEAQLEALGMM